MISDVRSYFDAVLKAENLKEHDDAFAVDNIARVNFNNSYHVIYTIPAVTEANDTMYIDQQSWTIQLGFKGFRKPQDALDNAMDISHTIRENLMLPSSITAFNAGKDYPILKISNNSIVAEPVESNDNSIVVTLEFNLQRAFNNC